MTLGEALYKLASVHTKDDDAAGFHTQVDEIRPLFNAE